MTSTDKDRLAAVIGRVASLGTRLAVPLGRAAIAAADLYDAVTRADEPLDLAADRAAGHDARETAPPPEPAATTAADAPLAAARERSAPAPETSALLDERFLHEQLIPALTREARRGLFDPHHP